MLKTGGKSQVKEKSLVRAWPVPPAYVPLLLFGFSCQFLVEWLESGWYHAFLVLSYHLFATWTTSFLSFNIISLFVIFSTSSYLSQLIKPYPFDLPSLDLTIRNDVALQSKAFKTSSSFTSKGRFPGKKSVKRNSTPLGSDVDLAMVVAMKYQTYKTHWNFKFFNTKRKNVGKEKVFQHEPCSFVNQQHQEYSLSIFFLEFEVVARLPNFTNSVVHRPKWIIKEPESKHTQSFQSNTNNIQPKDKTLL